MSPSGSSVVDRLARFLVDRAARRWPADLAEPMAQEWRAELAALRDEPAVRRLSFAGSLALSPAVEPDGAEPVLALEAWARSAAGAVGITVLAGALFNGVHTVQHRAGAGWGFVALLAGAAAVAVLGRRSHGPYRPPTVAVGAALCTFLLAGNRIAVMPFMGWIDVLPAVLTWTVATVLLVSVASRAGRRRWAPAVVAAGGLLTLELATLAGSLHGARSLGLGTASAPLWFPLALLPGGTVTFGPPLAVVGLPGFHASEMLLGNASAMAGPMLLCSVFLLSREFFPVTAANRLGWVAPQVPAAGETPGTWRIRGARIDLSIPLGVGAAVAALAACEAVRRMPPAGLEATWHRLLDNTTVFGFGFLAHIPGRVAMALAAGLLATHLAARRRPA